MMRTRGFTLVEMIVYILLSGIVMTSVYQLLIGQSRAYGKQRELMDVHGSLRAASALLSWEIRQGSASGGDLSAIGVNSIALRSVQGAGIVCAVHNTIPRVGLGKTWGDIDDTADDSALVYAADTDAWMSGTIDKIFSAPAGVPWCDWGGGASIVPEVVLDLTVSGDISAAHLAYCMSLSGAPQANCLGEPDWPTYCAGLVGLPKIACNAALAAAQAQAGSLAVGALFRAFRRVEYGLYEYGGRWWMGRKVGAAASYELLTGPLRSAVNGGLVFTYYDAAGAVTADPTQVAAVEFVIRAESYGVPDSKSGYQVDTLATMVAVRG